MAETYDWTAFYGALCKHGPHLLLRIDDDDGVREVIVMTAATEDRYWSDGLQDLLADHASDGDLRAGVVAVLELWRENVLMALSDDFGIDLDWDEVTIDAKSPLIDELVEAAAPEVS